MAIMRHIFVGALLILAHGVHAQYVYTIKADSVKITNCDSAELIIENHTQGIPGFLFNTGHGRTVFQRALMNLDDSTYLVGADTLHTLRLGYWAPNGTAIYNTNPGFVGINQSYPVTTLDVGGLINVSDTGYYNIGGQSVLKDYADNLLIGIGSAYNTTFSGGTNTVIGESAGAKSNIGGSTVLVGSYAGYTMQGGSDTYVGAFSGGYATGSFQYNSALGCYAGSYGSGQYNSSLGFDAGSDATGSFNVSNGFSAGLAANGSDNAYLGVEAGESSSGNLNSWVGYYSGNNSQGTDNAALGEYAGSDITGNANIYIGSFSGNGTTGYANICMGNFSCYDGGNISNNVAIGNLALTNLTGGSQNVAVGDSTIGPSFGSFNSFLGAWTGLSSFNLSNPLTGVTLVGAKADVVTTQGVSDATAIGYRAIVKTSNTMVFGDTAVNTWLFNSNAASGSNAALVVGNNATNGNGAYLTTGGVWTNASDRNKKENFQPLNENELLARIDQLPVTRWNYKGLHEQHIGPVAQDFYRLFHVGGDDLTISTIDPSGIALAGIQGLHQKIKDQQTEIDSLKTELQQERDYMRQIKEELSSFKAMLKPLAVTQEAYAKIPKQ